MINDASYLGPRRLPSAAEALRMVQLRRSGRDRTARRLASAHDIEDLRRIAKRSTPRPIFDFVDGGAGDESALRRNAASFEGLRLIPRVLRDVSNVNPSTQLLGRSISLPLILGPVGMTKMAHPDGEIGAARAAGRAGIPYVLSTMASTTPEAIAKFAPDTDRWFQLYLWQDRAASKKVLGRARDAGFRTLMLTVDVAVAGARLRDARNGMTLPPSLNLKSAAQIARYPRWWWNALTLEPIDFAMFRAERGGFAEQTNSILDPSATFADLGWLREYWDGPIVVKGVLSASDARAALDHGANAIMLSNHGGRQLENAIAPLEVLAEIRAAIGPTTPLLVDGGARSGAHVAAAVAAGANAVAIGRPYVYGLMAGGERGVDHAIALLRAGFERTMALLGAANVEQLVPEMFRLKGPASVGQPD